MKPSHIDFSWKEFVVALLLWISATLVSLYFIATEQHNNQRVGFLQSSYLLQNKIQESLRTNDVVMQRIAESVGPADLFQQNRIRSIAQEAIEPYPHIRSVLLFPTVALEEMDDFSVRFRDLYPSSPITADNHHSSLFSPIAFEYSRDRGMPQLLGMDAREVVALKGTIDMVADHQPLSSLPYRLGEHHHYLLVANAARELRHHDDSFPWYSKIHVALLIDPHRMVPTETSADITLSLRTPYNKEGRKLLQIQHDGDDHLVEFPLHYSVRLDSMSQPFLLETARTVPFVTLSVAASTLLVLFSLLYFLLVFRLIVVRATARNHKRVSDTKLRINTNNRIQMMHAISHDIRTPLTRLRLRARALGRGEQEKIVSDLDEIDQLVKKSINFLQEEQVMEEPTICDLNRFILTIQREMEAGGYHFTINGKAEWPYLCQVLELKRAVENLLNNAFHHGDRVELHVSDTRQHLTIEISDDGPGIEESRIDKVVRPYIRGDDSRGKNNEGIGLGLSIVHQICEAHGGQLLLRNRPQGGFSASLLLPR